jgi:hypothetical protein
MFPRITLALIFVASLATLARAGELTKEQCVDAHSRGQDAREQGKLSLARKLFLVCAQASCPGLVQSDCARFADDLGHLQPSVSFAVRDSSGADVPETSVFVDDVLVASRLDDGKLHELDPGKHVVRFTNAGRDQVVTIVLGTGEQGRAVVATFPATRAVIRELAEPDAAGARSRGSRESRATFGGPAPRPAGHTTHPSGATSLIVGGTVLAASGLAYGIYELAQIPSVCSLSTHQCSATPGDPVFASAAHAAYDADLGWAVAALGAVVAVSATIWYIRGAKSSQEHLAVTPWLAPGAGGLAIGGSL